MCVVIAYDPVGKEYPRKYRIPESKVDACRQALRKAGYYVAISF